jgi:hypothetical protein
MKQLAGIAVVALGCAIGAGVHAAHAYNELCAGPPVPGVGGPTTNGSFCKQSALGTSIEVDYLGSEAADEDIISLNGVNLIDNKTSTPGASETLSVSPGVLPFRLTNVTTGKSFLSATPYANTDFHFWPVYHFAYFHVTSESD